jgi:type VI secretion system protein ImpH
MTGLATLARALAGATLTQAARAAELGWGRRGEREVGRDTPPADEPIRFVASDRMGLVANDLADVSVDSEQIRIVANVLGLAGANPALPPPYSELQLQRRRARDPGLAGFFNLFDHRALSFFYRVAQKYSWPLLAERAGRGARDPVRDLLLSLAGIGVEGLKKRLDITDGALVTLTAHLGDTRRSAGSVATVLRTLTGLPLEIVEAVPVWMPVPSSEQTRIGGFGSFAQLGAPLDDAAIGAGDAAMIGAAVLDVQHHFLIDVGPLSYAELRRFCRDADARRLISQLCVLTVGLEQQPSIRLLIDQKAIPPLRLNDDAAPAMLGWTTWLGVPDADDGVARDCVIPLDRAALTQEKAVAA